MEYRKLGTTGLDVSLCCLGTMTFGQQNTEAEGHAQLDRAIEVGVNFLDTAELYAIPPARETQGSTERIIGSWLAARGGRDKLIIATKVVGRTHMDWFRDDGSPAVLDRRNINEAIDKSLKRLRTDYIDLYQLHWPDRPVSQWGSNPTIFRPTSGPEIAIEETLEALADLVKAGKVRHIGLSNESSWGTMTFLKHAETKGLPRVQSVQNAYSLLNRTYEVNMAEVSMREEVSLLAYSPLAQGFLSGKYLDGARPAGARTTLFNRGQRYETPGAEPAIRAYVEIARRHGLDPAQLAIKFCATRPFMTSVIIGATKPDQLEADLAAFDLPWSEDLEKEINAVHVLNANPCP